MASASVGTTEIAPLSSQALVAAGTTAGAAAGGRATIEVRSRMHMLKNDFGFWAGCLNEVGAIRVRDDFGEG
jgi:hypothetical protein